jgi:hypothetical protein
MKKIKCQIFRRTVKDRRRGDSYQLLYDFAEGVKAVGDEVEIVNETMTGPTQDGEMNITAPIGVMFGYGGSNQLHHTKGRRHTLVENAKKSGSVVITFDGGLCSSFGNTSGVPEHRYRVSLWTPMRNGEFFEKDSPNDRWNDMKNIFNIKDFEWQKKSSDDAPIIFVLQPSDNWSMNGLEPIEWFNDVYKKLRPLTKRKFIARPHPNHAQAMYDKRDKFPADVELMIPQKQFSGDEKKNYRFHFQTALNDCHAVVTHNSTASVDSCIRGIPTFVTSDLAICYPVANTDLSKIESPEFPDRTQWLNNLGYMMWTIDEIRSGKVYKRFRNKVEESNLISL